MMTGYKVVQCRCSERHNQVAIVLEPMLRDGIAVLREFVASLVLDGIIEEKCEECGEPLQLWHYRVGWVQARSYTDALEQFTGAKEWNEPPAAYRIGTHVESTVN
jgi:hypothetical protein